MTLVLTALPSAFAINSKTAFLLEVERKPMGNALFHLQLETAAPIFEGR